MKSKSSSGPEKEKPKVVVTKNGPYVVSGKLPLAKETIVVGEEGEPETWKTGEKYPLQENMSLCRCGNSKSKPFCDGTHVKTRFNGEETAAREGYLEQAEKTSGPDLSLTDVESLCAAARFCHRGEGTWNLIDKSADKTAKQIVIESACNCPSGRLVVWDKSGNPIEPQLEPSIGVVEDPQKKVSGPLRLKGGVLLESASGAKYETRNRVTLCRCGKSKNKPFCDGKHIKARFNDGDASLK